MIYYDYHLIIKELAEEFKGQLHILPNPFSSNRKKKKRIDKNGEGITKTISYRVPFIDNTIFMESSLSNLVNYFAEGIHKIKCKYGYDNKKCKTCGIKYKDREFCLEYTNIKHDLIECKMFMM